MKKLNFLQLHLDWITWTSSDESVIEAFEKKLEERLGDKFTFYYQRRNPGEEGTAEQRKYSLEKWRTYAPFKMYGLSVKGNRCQEVAKDFFFGNEYMDLRQKISITRVDLKLKYWDIISEEKLPSFKNAYEESFKFRENQGKLESTKQNKKKVNLYTSDDGQTLGLGARKDSIYTRLCYSPSNYYMEVEYRKYQARKLTKYFRAGDTEGLEAALLVSFYKECKELAPCPLVDLLQPQFERIRRIVEVITLKLDSGLEKPVYSTEEHYETITKFSARAELYQRDGGVLKKDEVVFEETLDKGDIFLIFLSIYTIYHEKILKSLSHAEYCKKLSYWSKSLDPYTGERIKKETDCYEPLTFYPRDLCDRLGWKKTIYSLKKIVEGVKYLHDIKLAYNADTDDKTRKEVSFFVFPTIEICRRSSR